MLHRIDGILDRTIGPMDWVDVGKRAVYTALQAAAIYLVAGGFDWLDIEAWRAVALAALGAGLSVVTSAVRTATAKRST